MISDPEVTIYMTVAATEKQPNATAPEGSAGDIEDVTMCDRAGGPPPTLPREAEDAARIILGDNHDRCMATIAQADLDLLPADGRSMSSTALSLLQMLRVALGSSRTGSTSSRRHIPRRAVPLASSPADSDDDW
eukprot:5529213-Pyramimonas_sp.AAC.1